MNRQLRIQSRSVFFLCAVVLALIGISLTPGNWSVVDTAAQATQKTTEAQNGNPQTDKKELSEHSRAGTTTSNNASSTSKPPTSPAGETSLTEKSPAAYDPNWDR